MDRLNKLAYKKELTKNEEVEFKKLFLSQENRYREILRKVLPMFYPYKNIILKGSDGWATIVGKEYFDKYKHVLIMYNRNDVLFTIYQFMSIGLHEIGHWMWNSKSDGRFIKKIKESLRKELDLNDDDLLNQLTNVVIINPFEDVRCDELTAKRIPAYYSWHKDYFEESHKREDDIISTLKKEGKDVEKTISTVDPKLDEILIKEKYNFFDLDHNLTEKEEEIYNKFSDFDSKKFPTTNSLARGIYSDVLPHIIDLLKQKSEEMKDQKKFEEELKRIIQELMDKAGRGAPSKEEMKKAKKEHSGKSRYGYSSDDDDNDGGYCEGVSGEESKDAEPKKHEMKEGKILPAQKKPEFQSHDPSEYAPGEGELILECIHAEDSSDFKPISKEVRFNHDLDYRQFLGEIQPMINSTKENLKHILNDNKHSRVLTNKRRGVLSFNKLHKVKSLNTKVFEQKELLSKKDYAFALLGDYSGSMANDKILEANKSEMLFNYVLEGINIPFIHGCFSDHLYIIKNFEQKKFNKNMLVSGIATLNTNNQRFGNASYNSDSWAIWQMANLLVQRPESEKIMIVFTDGWPASCYPYSESPQYDNNSLKTTVNKVEKQLGILVVGVGIIHEGVKDYYNNHIFIKNVEELPEQITKIFSKVIRKRTNA